jgi:branched-chain amino acid transport system substrate-binding protein
MIRLRRSSAVLMAVPIVLLSACGGSGDEGSSAGGGTGGPIKVGMVSSLTGPGAAFGVPMRNAAEATIDDINADGGVLGQDIELVVFDDATDPTRAAQGATELIDEGVVAIIGAVTSSTTLALAPVAASSEIPVMAIAAAVAVTADDAEGLDWTWRITSNDGEIIPAMFDRLVEDGHERVAIFAQDDAYGEYGTRVFEELAEGQGVEIVEVTSAAIDATDVTPQATRLRDADADVVVLQLQSVGLASSFLRAAEDVGLDLPMFGGMGMSQQALIDNAGAAADGLLTANVLDPTGLSANQEALYSLVEAGGNEPTYGFADLAGGDAARILAAAIEKAGKANGPAINGALADGLEVDGAALAPYSFSAEDHDGLPVPEGLVFTVVRDGAFARADS